MYIQNITKVLLFAAIFVFAQGLHAQMLDISSSYIFPDNSIFNGKFIQEKKIKTIKAEVATKRDNQIIKEDGVVYEYEFSPSGKIIKKTITCFKQNKDSVEQFPILNKENIIEQSIILYLYNDSLWLTSRSENDKYGTYTHYFTFNKYGNVTRQAYTKDNVKDFVSYDYKYDSKGNIIKGKNYAKKPFELTSHDTVFYETYDFDVINETQFRMICFNNDNKVYKEVDIVIDNTSKIIQVTTEYTIANKKSHYSYSYDDKKRIIKRIDHADMFEKTDMVTSYTYDEPNGNIMEENVTLNEQPSAKTQYIYDEKKQFLHSQITKSMPSNSIEIIKYYYEFYE